MKKKFFFCFLFISVICQAQNLKQLDFENPDSTNLAFLKDVIGDKRIVFLGEEGHWYGEYFQLKNMLIKFLVKEMGFSVVVFESSGKHAFMTKHATLSLQQRVDLTLNRYWTTPSIFDLMGFVKDNSVEQLGIDIISYDKTDSLYINYMKKIIHPYDSLLFEQYKIINKKISIAQGLFQSKNKSLAEEQRNSYRDVIEKVIELLKYNKSEILQAQKWEEKEFQYLIYSLQCSLDEITFLSQKGIRNHIKFRDQVMAENLEWILTKYTPDQKVIVWAANAHIAPKMGFGKKYHKKGIKSMGEFLSPQTKKESIAIALSPIRFLKEKQVNTENTVIFLSGDQLAPKDKERGFNGAFYFNKLTHFSKFY